MYEQVVVFEKLERKIQVLGKNFYVLDWIGLLRTHFERQVRDRVRAIVFTVICLKFDNVFLSANLKIKINTKLIYLTTCFKVLSTIYRRDSNQIAQSCVLNIFSNILVLVSAAALFL